MIIILYSVIITRALLSVLKVTFSVQNHRKYLPSYISHGIYVCFCKNHYSRISMANRYTYSIHVTPALPDCCKCRLPNMLTHESYPVAPGPFTFGYTGSTLFVNHDVNDMLSKC